MSRRRVYVPEDAADLRIIVAGQPWSVTGRAAYAVTPAARMAFAEDDEEDLEYDAFLCACRHRLGSSSQPGSGLVVSLDVETDHVEDVPPAGEPQDRGGVQDAAADSGFAVVLREVVPLAQVVSIHAPDSSGGPEEELLWYDVSEAAELLALLAASR